MGWSNMKEEFSRNNVYNLTDESIVTEICKKIRRLRLSCCCSQQEFANRCGMSIITIKRIESGKVSDITLDTLIKIMRVSGTLEGITEMIPELPESPFLFNEKTGKIRKRFNSNIKRVGI